MDASERARRNQHEGERALASRGYAAEATRTRLHLYANGLHLRLLTERGDVVAEGEAARFNERTGESLIPRQALADAHYIVHVARVNEGDSRIGEGRMPSVRAKLEMVR